MKKRRWYLYQFDLIFRPVYENSFSQKALTLSFVFLHFRYRDSGFQIRSGIRILSVHQTHPVYHSGKDFLSFAYCCRKYQRHSIFFGQHKEFLRFEIKFYPVCAKQLPIDDYGVKFSTAVRVAAEKYLHTSLFSHGGFLCQIFIFYEYNI